MIIEAVILFGLLSALFEGIIIMKIPPKARLRLLGSSAAVMGVHIITILFNLIVHFGTITGTMSAIVAGLASFFVIPILRKYSGTVKRIRMPDGNIEPRYFPGWHRYPKEMLR